MADPPPPPPPPWYDDLAGFGRAAWDAAARGAGDRRSAFHAPTLCTIGLDGGPRARVAVLRAADRAARTLRFHSDARADKVAEIKREPRACAVFYDKGAKLQVRMDGVATVHRPGSPLADEAWAATRDFSRTAYRVAPPAGTPHRAGRGLRPSGRGGRWGGDGTPELRHRRAQGPHGRGALSRCRRPPPRALRGRGERDLAGAVAPRPGPTL